jgi:hypothetical protein
MTKSIKICRFGMIMTLGVESEVDNILEVLANDIKIKKINLILGVGIVIGFVGELIY